MRSQEDQRQSRTSRGCGAEATAIHEPFQQQEDQGEPGQTNGDALPGRQEMQQPSAGKHITACGDHRTGPVQTLASHIGEHGPSGNNHLEDDQPAQGRADQLLGQAIEYEVGSIKRATWRSCMKGIPANV